MTKLKAITIKDNEEYLRQKSLVVDIMNDTNLDNDIKIIEEYCKENKVLAMASVQLGIPKRIIYIKNTNLEIIEKTHYNENTEEDNTYNEARLLINPVILSKEGLTEYWEACASCLDNMGRVLRPYKILVEYYDRGANKHQEIFVGFESTVLSHEMDHLDGILHIDIAKEVINMPREERKEFRKKHDYKVLSKTRKYSQLLREYNN